MDWALVLVSQGIEPTVDFSEEFGWGVIVPPAEQERALAVLDLYRTENRHWPWRQKILHPRLLFDWTSTGWAGLMGLFFWLSENNERVRNGGLMDGQKVSHGEWWRLFTAIFLHADIAHLTSNLSIGFVLLGFVMGIYGAGIGLLASFLAGAGGNLVTWLIDPVHRNLGASGMVMGALGLLAVQTASIWRENSRAGRCLFGGIMAGGMLFALLGTGVGSDVVAHLGGFLAGILLGTLWIPARRFSSNLVLNSLAGAFFAILVVLTWWLVMSVEIPT